MALGQFTLAEAAKLLNEASVTRKIADDQLKAETAEEYTPALVSQLNNRADDLEAQVLKLLTGGLA